MKKIKNFVIISYIFIIPTLSGMKKAKGIFLDKPAAALGRNIGIFKKEVIAMDSRSFSPLLSNGTPAIWVIPIFNNAGIAPNTYKDASGNSHVLTKDPDGNWIPTQAGSMSAFKSKIIGNKAAYVTVITSYIAALIGLGIGSYKLISYISQQRKISKIKKLIISGHLNSLIKKSDQLNKLKVELDSTLDEKARSEKLTKLAELILNNKVIAELVSI